MAYTTYEFDDGSSNGTFFTGTTHNFTDVGVSFTISVTKGRIEHNNPVGDTGVGNFAGSTNGQTAAAFTLTGVSTGGKNLFSGTAGSPLKVTFAAATAASVTFVHATNPALNFTKSVTALTVTAPNGQYSAIKFTGIGYVVERIQSNFACFLRGTRIATLDGPVAVETLRPGDKVVTDTGDVTTVRWLGHQHVNTRLTHPVSVNPVCIRAGAFGDGLPERDLYLSPDHALGLDGVLVNAGALVNGSSVRQVDTMPPEGFTYYHVETEAHELLLAEGCAAESFIDHGAFPRQSFDNAAEAPARGPVQEMPLLRISSPRLVPADIRARLAARAGLSNAA